MGMKVLVIGSGAREHAIAHALLSGNSVSEVTVAPGNPGMRLDGIWLHVGTPDAIPLAEDAIARSAL